MSTFTISIRGPRHFAVKAGVASLVGLLLGGALTGCGSGQNSAGTAAGPDAVDGATTSPWAAPANVTERVAAAGLDLGPMGMAEHYHPHLRVVVDGDDIPVPPGLGVDPATGAMSAVHTHEGDGTIHVEASTVGETFTLGQLFTLWGVDLTRTQIGGMTAAAGETVAVTNNGVAVAGDPTDLRLQPDQKIVVRLRSPASR